MQQENERKTKRQLVFNKTNIILFAIGFLTATLLATISILLFFQPQNKNNDDNLLGSLPPLGDTVVINFDQEVMRATEPVLLLIVAEGTLNSEINTMFESVRSQWNYELKQYTFSYDKRDLQKLEVYPSELPVFCLVHKGKLIGKQRVLNIVQAGEILSWAQNSIPKKENTPLIYKAFSNSYTIKKAYLPDDYAKGELTLFPFSWTVEGFKECTTGSTLKASEHSKLYELLGKPSLNDNGAFSLPNYESIIPTTGRSIRYFMSLEGYIPEENQELSVSSVNGITYIEYPIARNSYPKKEIYLGEIVLGKYLSEDDLNQMYLLPCDGRNISINTNQALFSLLVTTYGGDGRTVFALPDLSNVEVPIDGAQYYISYGGLYPMRP